MRFPALLAALLLTGAPSAQDGADVAAFRLESGVEVRIERVPGATAMGLFLFVESGYADDPPGATGLAHLTEHMVMTAGTPVRPEVWNHARWSRERLGANATTYAYSTLYWSLGTRKQLSVDARRWADVLAGRAKFTEAAFEFERVMMLRETINMTEATPGGVLQWRARVLALAGERGARQGIGIRSEVEKIELDAVRRHYLAYHRPRNALLVAVGRVDPVKDRPFYEEVFGSLPNREPAAPPAPAKTPPPAAVTEHPRALSVHASFAFHVPPPRSPEFPAFLLAAVWFAGQARRSFSFRALEGLGFFQPGLFPILEDPRLLFINRRGKAGQTLVDLRKELTDWVAKTSRSRISVASLVFPRFELENLLDPLPRSPRRRRLVAAQPRMLYRVGLARGAARLWGFPDDLWARIEKVRPEQVAALVRARFRPEAGLFLALVPAGK